MSNEPIAFIGGGNMARSLISGLLAGGWDGQRIIAGDPDPEQRALLGEMGVQVTADNQAAVEKARVVVLAVKPQILKSALTSLKITRETLLVSIAAGVPVRSLKAWTTTGQPIVRCMPNTPALLGAGITALFPSASVSESDRDLADTLLRAAGRTLWVDEEAKLDAVTAVSGSGPAYYFYLMEAMIAAGVEAGLDVETATELTIETAYGAALMARERTEDPAGLRANVTSPGGTTERALSILDEAGAHAIISRALAGAASRSRELAEEFGST